ncbi:hypothetical protein IFR05_003289 [Cadophora sp. M221]|nr:hypothetical protein IFR05_003289 [Cadophora sp. M221]
MVEFLLSFDNIAVQATDALGRTPLWYAAKAGQNGAETIAVLATSGRVGRGYSTLMKAVWEGEEDIVASLLVHKDKLVLGGFSHNEAPKSIHREVSEDPTTLEAWSLMELKTPQTALHAAIQSPCKHHRVANLLLEQVENAADYLDGDGCSVLHYAARLGRLDRLQFLLNRLEILKTKLGRGDNRGRTPLMTAVIYGQPLIVEELLKYPEHVDFNQKDDHYRTALMLAATPNYDQNGQAKAVSLLANSGLVDIWYGNGMYALDCAVYENDLAMIEILVKAGGRAAAAKPIIIKAMKNLIESTDKKGFLYLFRAATQMSVLSVDEITDVFEKAVREKKAYEVKVILSYSMILTETDRVRLRQLAKDIGVDAEDMEDALRTEPAEDSESSDVGAEE